MGRVAQGGVRACEIVKANTIRWKATPTDLCKLQCIKDEVKLAHFRCRCQLLCGECERCWTNDRADNAKDSEDSASKREREGRQESRRNRKAQLAARARG